MNQLKIAKGLKRMEVFRNVIGNVGHSWNYLIPYVSLLLHPPKNLLQRYSSEI